MKTCPKCSTEHNKPGIFCSRPCANSRTHSNLTKKKIATGWKTWYRSLSEDERLAFIASKINQDSIAKCIETKKQKMQKMAWEELGAGQRKKIVLQEQNYACLMCSITEWNGSTITLELDHIDGNTKNNSRNNLRCLCPNCHSQTPTFRKGFKIALPSDSIILETYKNSNSMTEILDKLNLKWGSYVVVIKSLERSCIKI